MKKSNTPKKKLVRVKEIVACKNCGRRSGFYGFLVDWLEVYEGLEWGYNYPNAMRYINRHFRKVLDIAGISYLPKK